MNKPQKNDNNNNFFNKNPLITFIIFAVVTIVAFKLIAPNGNMGYTNNNTSATNIPANYSSIKRMIEDGKVSYVGIGKTYLKVKTTAGQIITVKRVIGDTTLVPLLDKEAIPYGAITENTWVSDLLFGWIIPIFIFFAIWMFLANRMQKNMGGGILGIGNSKDMINAEKPDVKFDDMAGNQEAKDEVKEIVDFLKNPQRYIDLGAKIPKGVLLVGPPGTGKTLLAKAVAGEADVAFFAVNGSSFIEMFVGVGASRVRDLFAKAKKDGPAIIFIDEIDAIGKSRAGNGMGGNDEREQTLNQLLAEMDGFSSDVPVIILAATNRPEVLDPALLRPGRFDRQVLVDKPDYEGRVEILNVHIKGYKLAKNINIEDIAKMTAGLAGADLANIVNEASLLAGRANKKEVEQSDFLEAIERAIAGLEKKSRRINEKEKRIVAYHESGHALIAEVTEGAKKVKKVSIVPRGLAALGYTLNTPEENRFMMQKHELIAEIDVLLGGRAAEQVFIKEISTGASNDLERATDMIKSMVTTYGMSDVAGLMVLEKHSNQFLGGGYGSGKDYSEKMSEKIDEFTKNLLNERYAIVLDTLSKYEDVIEKMVAKLYEKEVIKGEEVRSLIKEFQTPSKENDEKVESAISSDEEK